VTAAVASHRSKLIVGSKLAALARSVAEVLSRRVTSSDSTICKKSACDNLFVFANAKRSGKVVRT
jgi:5-methylthioribose kinase